MPSVGIEPERATTTCRSCGAEILWAVTPNGKKMPLDATPQKRIVLEEQGTFGEVAVVHDTFVPHFATCPNADEHRRRGGD